MAGVPLRSIRKAPGEGRMKEVKSGIALADLSGIQLGGVAEGNGAVSEMGDSNVETVMQSRTARVLLAGAGFLADAYDLFVINLVLRLLRDEYPSYTAQGLAPTLEGQVASAALVGSILGQLVAGSSADIVGRKAIFVATAALITIGSVGSSFCSDSNDVPIYTRIACWRFFLGLGVGGEYPLAATVTSESSSAASRGRLMTAVFSMQGIGSLVSAMIVYVVLILGFDAGFAWRFALFCGALPAIIAFPWRLRMHETETFERIKRERRDAKEQIESTVIDASLPGLPINGEHVPLNNYQSINGSDLDRSRHLDQSVHSVSSHLAVVTELSGRLGELRRAFFFYKWHILGTSLSWFLLDVDFYANGLFNHDITALILSPDAISTAMDDAWNSGFICLVGLPGYLLSYLYIDSFGRKNIQMLGFAMMCLLYLLCSYGHDFFMATDVDDPMGTWMRRSSYLLVYSLTFLFSNFGPNATSFVVPGEIYPAEVRATAHGLSAAFGKLGAACGAYFFPLFDYRESMRICALVAGLGVAVTYFFTPRYDAEDLRVEDTYIALEHECFRPNEVTAEQYKKKKSGMIHVIDSSYDFETLLEDGIE